MSVEGQLGVQIPLGCKKVQRGFPQAQQNNLWGADTERILQAVN
jgi:hypothetical protein